MTSTTGRVRGGAVLVTALLLLTGCSSDDTSGPGDTAAEQDPATAEDDTGDGASDDGEGDDDGGATAGGQGTLTIDGEQATVDRVFCALEPEDLSGQIIEVSAQARGATAGGEDVLLDFTRFGEGPAPEGDSVSVTFGDVTSPDAKSFSSMAGAGLPPAGTVSVDGSAVSVTDLALADEDGGSAEVTVSFDLQC